MLCLSSDMHLQGARGAYAAIQVFVVPFVITQKLHSCSTT